MNDNCECGDAQDQIYQYLDSELDEATAASIRAHLDDCPPCFDSFDFERRLKMVVRDHLSEEVPDGLEAKVKALIREETP
jgi:mycothiol system anti-sigma-R factor